jgi:hypothetical protein
MPSDISPNPDIHKATAHSTSGKRRSSRCGAAALITISPYKKKLTEDLEKKVAREGATRRRKLEKSKTNPAEESKTQLMRPQERGDRK